jgi:hypothetical protein
VHFGPQRLLGNAAEDALVGRYVVVVTTVADDDVALVDRAVVGRIERNPAVRRRPELDPGVTLRGLAALALDVQVTAHVTAGDPAEPEQAQHQVGEVLTDPGADREEVLGGRVVLRHVRLVLESLRQVVPQRLDVFADRHGAGGCGRLVRRPQRRRQLHGPVEGEEVEQRVGPVAARQRIGEGRQGERRRVGADQRAARHLDPVVEARDGEVMGDVVVPVEVSVHAGGRAHRQHERRHRLITRRLGLHAQLHERLADVGVVVEREAVLDLEQHRQVAKYWAATASWAWAMVSTTRSRNAGSTRVAPAGCSR